MQNRRCFYLVLVLFLTSGSAFAAIGNEKGGAPQSIEQVAAADNTEKSMSAESVDAERIRKAGTEVCNQAVSAATSVGETFRQMSTEILPAMVQVGQQFAREMTPVIRQLNEHFAEMARQLDRSLQEKQSNRSSDPAPEAH